MDEWMEGWMNGLKMDEWMEGTYVNSLDQSSSHDVQLILNHDLSMYPCTCQSSFHNIRQLIH